MRTGVIVVDSGNRIHRINESAWHLLGNPSHARRDLGDVAPELSRRLYQWRHSKKADAMPVSLAPGMPEVIPRFASLAQGDPGTALIFLDDTTLLSRQAEQLTLSSLGRLSASVAHEVRNPLAAISYSAQLLSESEALPETDQRLVDIIRMQCTRMNAIVENILQLSRRERSRPEQIDPSKWIHAFVDEYRSVHPAGDDELRVAVSTPPGSHIVFDPNQLQQVLWNLIQNAVRYGRQPDNPARVTIGVHRVAPDGRDAIDVIDRGPGIPQKVVERIFEPFFTTHEHGTGLGLYIARELCEVNQATLEYLPVPGGGSCFRIVFGSARTSVPAARASERGRA
jgi:two-component system sensor histidine kinase PilS (NtrC family)